MYHKNHRKAFQYIKKGHLMHPLRTTMSEDYFSRLCMFSVHRKMLTEE